MRRTLMKSKIHRATVTEADLTYNGSISVDRELLSMADILEHEKVHVLNVNTGARFETYAIPGKPGQICLNGAAARVVQKGDSVIVITYAEYEEDEARKHKPTVVLVDGANQPVRH